MTTNNAPVIDPQLILKNNKEKEQRYSLVKSSLLDIFFVFYSIIVLQRAIYYKFILNLKDMPFSWHQIGILFLISVVIGTGWTLSRTSLSAKLFGIAKDNNVTKWTIEIFGFFLFNITFVLGRRH